MNKSIKKIGIKTSFIILALFIILTLSLYLGNSQFRNWTDRKVLNKDIEDEKLPTIYLESNEKTHVYTYSNNVVTLEDNRLKIYNKYAKEMQNINVSISNPKFASKGDYLLIADEGGSKLYLLYNNNIQWEKEVEGQIAQICVNKNGAVGVIVTGTTYRSVIVMYDITGKENFKTFLSTTNAIDLDISEDNNYLSFIEINTSGATILSKVKTVSVEKAISKPDEAIVNTYEMDTNILLIKLRYKKNKIVTFADNAVYILNNNNKEKVLDITNNISFVDISLDGYVACIKEEENKYELDLINTENQKINTYLINDAIKKIYCNENITAIDVGNKVDFVNNGAWLEKKFTSHQNIKDIKLGRNIATIIYKDRIELIEI